LLDATPRIAVRSTRAPTGEHHGVDLGRARSVREPDHGAGVVDSFTEALGATGERPEIGQYACAVDERMAVQRTRCVGVAPARDQPAGVDAVAEDGRAAQ
jgi:hypothetical protein